MTVTITPNRTHTHTHNQTTLITGACGGIGSCVAKDLARKGHDLVLVDVNTDSLATLANDLATLNPNANIHTVVCDFTQAAQVTALCEQIADWELDIAFLNAGITVVGNVTEISPEQLTNQIDINFRSTLLLNQACAKNMVKRGSGHIVNTVSTGALVPLKGGATYSGTKFGLRGFLAALYAELKPQGVHVSGIYPSGVDTPMLRYEATNGGSPLNFLSTPQTPQDVLVGFHKALTSKKLEVYVPFTDGVSGRLVSLVPSILPPLYPLLEKLGERGRKKYIMMLNQLK